MTSHVCGTQVAYLVRSYVLQQRPLHPHPSRRLRLRRKLVFRKRDEEFPDRAAQQHHCSHGILWSVFGLYIIHLSLVCSCHLVDYILHGRCTQQIAHCGQRSHLL